MTKDKKIQVLIKRIFGVVLSSLALIIFSPIILIVAVLVRINLGSPIFFTQERVGKDNKVFKMIKFRSMKDGKDKNGNLLPDKDRLTTFGKKLRSSSLDEMPELINVLKGDMSLVGPRPLLVEYLQVYNERQLKRHDVMPGLTGFAQVNGRNSISWREKLELDVSYVENWSLALDLKILFLTVFKVFKKEGINQQGNVTMEKFNGYN
ncbi:MAG: sugar transferase [Sarcina sp.]